jgi:hypothetical protein
VKSTRGQLETVPLETATDRHTAPRRLPRFRGFGCREMPRALPSKFVPENYRPEVRDPPGHYQLAKLSRIRMASALNRRQSPAKVAVAQL